ncbi:MAG: thermonuclease family protein [Leptolyngbya sp. RL_3_1]|nr:thermonuclease family protein [Leptolyngbya sp. RL_3_1]
MLRGSTARCRLLLQLLLVGVALVGVIVLGVQSQSPRTVAVVDYAVSGQSLALLYPLETSVEVSTLRLAGITAPDLDQAPWGPAARDCLNQQVRDQTVRIEAQDPEVDSFGRLWAYVWRGENLVNQILLAEGCAYIDETALLHHPQSEDWIYAQERARILGLGIWDPDQPLRQSPQAFRQAQTTPSSITPSSITPSSTEP